MLITISACDKGEINNNLRDHDTQTSKPTQPKTTESATKEPIVTTKESNTRTNSPKKFLEKSEMPVPFDYVDGNYGGDLYFAFFALPVLGEISSISMNLIETFTENDDFTNWTESFGINKYMQVPVTSLMDYPNLFSFIVTFNIPITQQRYIYRKWSIWILHKSNLYNNSG